MRLDVAQSVAPGKKSDRNNARSFCLQPVGQQCATFCARLSCQLFTVVEALSHGAQTRIAGITLDTTLSQSNEVY